MESVWSAEEKQIEYSRLHGNIKTDVLIIGGGIAGLLCGYKLQKAGVGCVIAERKSICGGVTGRTTAKITAQHGIIYDKLIDRFGFEKARMYLEANQKALDEYKNICKSISCDFSEKDAYVYSRSNRELIEKEISAIRKIGGKADFKEDLPLPFKTVGAAVLHGQAQFSPLKFLFQIAKNQKIYENTEVIRLDGLTAVTKYGKIKAKKIIIATHFPFINKHGSYFLKMYQQRSYVSAFENAPCLDGMYIDEKQGGFSFRNHGDLLLIGEGSHRTGKQSCGWQNIHDLACVSYPKANEKYSWATQDCITLDGVPYIGEYSAATPDLYVATGFNKWGMTSAMAAADLLCDMICGIDNPYRELFNPSRTMIRFQLALNGIEAVADILSFSKKRCPHLGCALKRNVNEHSWDCPCHGSRFSQSGELLDNPAVKGIDI